MSITGGASRRKQRTHATPKSKLNLGCGSDIREGWHNVDVVDQAGVDQVYNLEITPWPWPEDCAETILMDNVFEHLHPRCRMNVLSECKRILEHNGTLRMSLPVPAVGTGWDVTHYAVPSWRWPLHPEQRSDWELVSIRGSRVGPGRVLPERAARWLTRQGAGRFLDEVTIEVKSR